MPLKEIKTKPENGKPRLLDSAAKAPKTAMKDAWLKSKEKAVSELKGTPFASQQGETSNAPANSAGDQMLSGIETTAKKSANITYRGGKKLAQTTARKVKEKREISRTLSEAKNAGSKTEKAVQNASSKIRTKNAAVKGIKGKPQKARGHYKEEHRYEERHDNRRDDHNDRGHGKHQDKGNHGRGRD